MSDRAGDYIVGLFGAEDELLASLREEADRTGLPPIAVSADEGRLLQVLLTAIRARRVLEVGTLGRWRLGTAMASVLQPERSLVEPVQLLSGKKRAAVLGPMLASSSATVVPASVPGVTSLAPVMVI